MITDQWIGGDCPCIPPGMHKVGVQMTGAIKYAYSLYLKAIKITHW
jgi:hypothetical protein